MFPVRCQHSLRRNLGGTDGSCPELLLGCWSCPPLESPVLVLHLPAPRPLQGVRLCLPLRSAGMTQHTPLETPYGRIVCECGWSYTLKEDDTKEGVEALAWAHHAEHDPT